MKAIGWMIKRMFAFVLALGLGASAWAAALDVTFVDLDGKPVKLSDYRGKFVVVNYWATWCPPCLVEIPDLVMFHEAHKDRDAVVIGVNYEDIPPEKVKAFAESQMINYPVVRQRQPVDGRTTPFGPLEGLPTTFMIDPQGSLVARHTGMVDQKGLEDFMKKYCEMHRERCR